MPTLLPALAAGPVPSLKSVISRPPARTCVLRDCESAHRKVVSTYLRRAPNGMSDRRLTSFFGSSFFASAFLGSAAFFSSTAAAAGATASPFSAFCFLASFFFWFFERPATDAAETVESSAPAGVSSAGRFFEL